MNNRKSLHVNARRETRFPSSIPLDNVVEVNDEKASPGIKQETNLDLSIDSDIEDHFQLFAGCSVSEIEELRSILSSDKRSKDDLKLLAKKLQDIPFFQAIIQKFGLDEDKDALLYFFKLIRLKEFNEYSTVYEQGDQSNSQAYVLFSGEAYLIDLSSTNSKKNELMSPTRILSMSQTSKFDLDEKAFGTRKLGSVIHMSPESDARPSLLKTELDFAQFGGLERLGSFISFKDMDCSPNKRSSIDAGHRNVVRQIQKFFAEGNQLPSYLKCQKESPVKPLQPGKHMGQKALWSLQRRDHTIVTKTACELIVIHADILKYIKKKIDVNKAKRIKLIRDCFPSLQLEKEGQYAYFFSEVYSVETFYHNQYITIEGNTSDYFYIIMEGTCELNKKVLVETNPLSNPLHDMKHFFVLPLSSTEQVNIFSLNEKSFAGDELLFTPQDRFWYSVKVTSPEARVLAFNRRIFLNKFPKNVIDNLKEQYQKRQNHIYQILVQNLQLRGYKLQKDVFFESGKISVELEQDSNLRTFYAHHIKPSKDQGRPSVPMNRLSLESVKEKINSTYSHKLRISNPYFEAAVGTRNQRSTANFKTPGANDESKVRSGSVTTRGQYDSPRTAESNIKSPGLKLPSYFVNQRTNLSGSASASGLLKSGVKLELPMVPQTHTHRDHRSSTLDTDYAYHLPLSANRASGINLIDSGLRKHKESTVIFKEKLEEDLGPDRLSFLKTKGDKRSSSRKKLSLRAVKKDSNGNDSSANSPRSQADYAQIARTRYKSKFCGEEGETFETFADVMKSQGSDPVFPDNRQQSPQPQAAVNIQRLVPNQIDLGKPVFQDAPGPSPRLDLLKKNNFINIHVQHKKKLNPLQRYKNRADLG